MFDLTTNILLLIGYLLSFLDENLSHVFGIILDLFGF